MGEPQPDDSFFVVLNSGDMPAKYLLPEVENGGDWELVLDTGREDDAAKVVATSRDDVED